MLPTSWITPTARGSIPSRKRAAAAGERLAVALRPGRAALHAHPRRPQRGRPAHEPLDGVEVVAAGVRADRGHLEARVAGELPDPGRVPGEARRLQRAAVAAPEVGRVVRGGVVGHPPLDAVEPERRNFGDRLLGRPLREAHGADGDAHGRESRTGPARGEAAERSITGRWVAPDAGRISSGRVAERSDVLRTTPARPMIVATGRM